MGAPYCIINHTRKEYIMNGSSSMYGDELEVFCPFYVKLFQDEEWSLYDDIEFSDCYHEYGVNFIKFDKSGDEELFEDYKNICPFK